MRTLSYLGIIALFCLNAGCISHKNEIAVTGQSFQNEVQLQENLVFTFNRELYPDSLLGTWDSTHYIRFEPAVAGRFKWDYASELLFSPKQGFEPGTQYTATLTNRLLSHAKKNYQLPANPVFHFHTPYLAVTGTNISWTRGKTLSNLLVQADLQFNYDVNLTQAVHYISLRSDGRKIDFTVTGSGTDKTLSLQFPPINDLDQQTPLTIWIKKGISVVNSHYTCMTDTLVKAVIPSRYNLSITNVLAEHTGTEGTITVYTSQPMLEDSLKNDITLSPSVHFDVQVNDQGFLLISKDFDPKTNYQLNISQQAQGIFGGMMKAPFSQQVSFGKLQPAISFANTKGIYLSGLGYRNLALNIVSVPRVRVTVVKVYENNLENFFSKDMGENYGSSSSDDDDDGGDYQYYDDADLGDTIFQKDYDTKSLPSLNAARVLHLDFQDKIRDFKGIYVLTVASTSQYWITQSRVIALSDIGLIVRSEKDAIYVFANSIKTTQPIAGASISFYSSNNQKLYTAMTGNDGVAVFDHIRDQVPGFTVSMVTARKDADFNCLLFSQAGIETSRFDVGGKRKNDAGLEAMIYGDRNLYRPGETIHMSVIVRDEHWQCPGEIPVKIVLSAPDGKPYATIRKILSHQGSCETDIPTLNSSMTGDYTLSVYTGNGVLLSSTDLSIEEFIPDRIKVNLNLDKPDYGPGDSIRASGHSDNLFGTPAVNRNYQYELNLGEDLFTLKQFPDYLFKLEKDFSFNSQDLEGKTDGKGNCTSVMII